MSTRPVVEVPRELRPLDGRFGSGPAKVRAGALARLEDSGLMGTSHRQPPVLDLVARARHGLAALLGAPEGHEVVLGNGGTHAFWDMAMFGLIERRSAHATYGEFSARFAANVAAAPHLADPAITEAAPGSAVLPDVAAAGVVDTWAWAQNETSTGALAPVRRVSDHGLVLIDATSAAGGVETDLTQCDAYYFAPQKCLASDGGLWLAVLSPAAIERAQRLSRERWCPPFLDLWPAIENSRKNQTLNTPAIATLFLLVDQVEAALASGGLAAAAARSRRSSEAVYRWAEQHPLAQPFVAPEHRSPVVATIDVDESVDAAWLARCLRASGIVDTEPYRKLGRNQLRLGLYPPVDPADAEALTRCLDFLFTAWAGPTG